MLLRSAIPAWCCAGSDGNSSVGLNWLWSFNLGEFMVSLCIWWIPAARYVLLLERGCNKNRTFKSTRNTVAFRHTCLMLCCIWLNKFSNFYYLHNFGYLLDSFGSRPPLSRILFSLSLARILFSLNQNKTFQH